MTHKDALIVGAGFSGAVIARTLAEAGQSVTVIDARPHVAGNCYTERDAETDVMIHVYGPHIFHTGDEEVWDYVNRFGVFRRYDHRVKTTSQGAVYLMPVNLHTINQFYGKTFGPAEAAAHIAAQASTDIDEPANFEEQAMKFIGPDLYGAFFKGYTEKQWGCSPRDLPASILKRLPVRFSYNDSYFAHPHQGMPEEGYTAIVAAILDHPGIELRLGTEYEDGMEDGFGHLFWSGPLDGYFGYALGRLGYRTLDFERFTEEGDYQGCAVMNYGDSDVPFTRITEHKHFAPWESHEGSVCYREFSRECGPDDIPYYPIRMVEEKKLLADYVAKAQALEGVTFVGRLGSYRYLDMDVSIREALDCARGHLAAQAAGTATPAFSVDPL